MVNGLDTKPEESTGTAWLFNADAQAILEEAPDLETGLSLLGDAYGSQKWDDPAAAAKITSDYAQQLRYRFEENPRYSDEEIQKIAPIDIGEINGEGETQYDKNLDKITKWEDANKQFLDTTTDPDYLLTKDKLKTNIENYASNLRRPTSRGAVEKIEDIGIRFAEGLTAGPANAIGATDYVKWLHEKTNPSYDDDFSSDLATGAGQVSGAIAGGAMAGPVGAGAYLVAGGAGQVRVRVNQALEDTGDKTKALEAGAIETGSQIIQAVPGGVIFGRTGKSLAAKALGRPVAAKLATTFGAQVAKNALAEGTSEAVGQVISNKAESVATNQEIDPFTNVGRSFTLGAIFGAASGALDTWSAKRDIGEAVSSDPSIPNMEAVIDPEVVNIVGGIVDQTDVQSVGAVNTEKTNNPNDVAPIDEKTDKNSGTDFVTSDGNRYSHTPEGATKRTKVATGEVFQPFDKTFFVDKETAAKLSTLRDEEGPDGSPVNILTDGNKLYVKSGFVANDLTIGNEPTGARLVEVPTKDSASIGLHPVEVNRPRNQNGNLREYRSHIGREIKDVFSQSTVPPNGDNAMGAAYDPRKEVESARKLYDAEGLDPAIRSIIGFGEGEDSYIYSRYFEKPNAQSLDVADKFIAENGYEAAAAKYIHGDDSSPETEALGARLITNTVKAVEAARLAGDDISASKLAELDSQLFDAYFRRGTQTGQTLQARNIIGQIDPRLKVEKIRRDLTKDAIEETASELSITPTELAKTDTDLHALDKEISTTEDVIKRENEINQRATEEQYDPEIQETGKLIQAFEKAGKDSHSKYRDQETAGIRELEHEADTLENERNFHAEKQVLELEDALRTAESRLEEIEREGEQRVKDQQRAIEEADAKVKELEAKVTPETKKSALNEIQRLKKKAETAKAAPKTKEDLITPSEKKEIERLTKLLAEGKGKVQRIKSTKGMSEGDRAKVKKLRDRVAEKKLALDTTTPDEFLTPKEKGQREALIKKRDELREKKAKAQKEGPKKSALSEEQEKKLQDLVGKKNKLSERKKKFEEKKKEKLKDFDSEKEKLQKLFTMAKETTGSRQQDILQEAFKLQDKLKKNISKKQPQASWLNSFYLANILSNPVTQAKNVYGNLTRFLQESASLTASGLPLGKADGAVFFKEGLKGIFGPGAEAAKLELKGIQTFKPDFSKGETDTGALNRPRTKREEPAIGLLKYAFRGLSAMDAAFYHGTERGWQAALIYNKEFDSGLRGKELNAKVSNELFNSKKNWEDAYKQATEESELLRDVGIKYTDEQNKLRAWEILRQKLPEDIQIQGNRFAKRATFTEKPPGIVGVFASGANYLKELPITIRGKEYRPLRYLQPFINTPANILNSYADFVPGVGALNRATYGFLSPLEQRSFLGKQAIGTVLTAGLYGLMMSGIDDKDPYFAVYGDGPDSYDQKKQMQAQGWKPRSIKIGENYFTWENSGLDFVLGSLGAYSDAYRWSPAYDKKTGLDFAQFLLAKNMKSFTNNSFLRGLGDTLKAVTGDEDVDYKTVLANLGRGYVPGAGALHEVTRWIETPIETKDDLWAKFISGVPMAQEIGTRKSLNAFGDEIDGTLDKRVGFISSFYSDRVTDPDWRFLAESGYVLPDDRGITAKLFDEGKKNSPIAIERAQKYGDAYFNVLTPEERHRYVKESGSQVREIVSKYRSRYGGAGFQKSVQDQFNKEISQVRNAARQRIAFGR